MLSDGLKIGFVAVKALNEINASLGWRVVYAWVGDNPCGDVIFPHGLVLQVLDQEITGL